MNHEKLKITHRKLTILFTLMVCSIVFIMGFSTLSAKYYNELRLQKRDFDTNSREIQTILNSQNIALRQLFFNQILEKRSIEEGFGRRQREIQSTMSFFIINSENEIIFENILEDVNFGKLSLPADSEIYMGNGVLYRLFSIHPRYGQKVLLYERVRYNIDDFLHDTLLLLIVVIIFSYFVYFLGYRFVGRNLLPVSDNLDDMQAFIHNAGHELKTPLAIVRGNLQVMQAEKKYDEHLLELSIASVDATTHLLESLRELSEVGKLAEKEKLSLFWEIEKIREKFEDLRALKNIEFLGLSRDTFYLSANIYELELLLSNLIKNALKYTPAGGKVEISLTKNILSIKDTGIGIPKEEQEKIFERFYQGSSTRSTEGYGIGLSLVKKIADSNGWKLEVESELGKGSVFRVIF